MSSIPDWMLIALEGYTKLLLLDDAHDFGKIRGQMGVHHWTFSLIGNLWLNYLLNKRTKEKKMTINAFKQIAHAD